MKHTYILLILLLMGTTTCLAKAKQAPVYIFGVAASFNDSTIFITDIQLVDKAWTDQKTKFLMSCQDYSYQLRDHLAKRGLQHMTCITFHKADKKTIERKYESVKKRYTNGKHGKFVVNYLSKNDFSYVVPPYSNIEEKLLDKSARKKAKALQKEKLKEAKVAQPKHKKRVYKAKEGESKGTLF